MTNFYGGVYTEYGRIDPHNRLAAGQVQDWLSSGHELTEEKVAAINLEIEAWAKRDPSGHSDYEAQDLDDTVRLILKAEG